MNRPSSQLRMSLFMSTLLRVAAGSVLRDGQGSDVVKLFVTEGDDVILPCSPRPNMNIEAKLFDWKKDNKEVFLFNNGNYYGVGLSGQDEEFKGRVSHFVDELKHGNASILLRDTRITDSGNYTCYFPHLGSGQTRRVQLVVEMTFKNRLGQIKGVALPPYVKIRNVTGDGVLLECFVRDAYPQPEVEWQTSDGSVVPAEEPHVSHRGHRFDVLLLTTVNKTNTYHCVVKQKGFGHVIHNELFVPDNLFEDKSCHCTSVLMVVIITIFSTLVIALLGGFLVKTIMNQRKHAKTEGSSTEMKQLNGHQLSNGS